MTAEYQDLPENFTMGNTWGDLADDLLCAGKDAADITARLHDVWPDYEWFVLVQDNSNGWAGLFAGEYHMASDVCGKNMVVWMYSGSVSQCKANAVSAAQTLIDKAITTSSTPNGVLEFIQARKYNKYFHLYLKYLCR